MEDILQDYIKHPLKSKEPKDFTVMYEEGNVICDDSMEIFLKIENNALTEINYTWQLSMTGQWSLTFLNDVLIWKNIKEILNLTTDFFTENWIEVSHRRKKTVSLPLVAIINAIKKFQWEKDFVDLEEFVYG